MKTSQLTLRTERVVLDRLADFVELTKPRIGALVLVTVGVGVALAAGGSPDPFVMLHVIVGTGLVASGSCVLNQWMERDFDRRMARTANRPLPAGRIQASEALAFGVGLSTVGSIYLLVLSGIMPAVLAFASLALYVWAYTPLKRHSSLNTVVGAVSGALPPIIGWSAVQPFLGSGALCLFLILFVWQFPHFLAIAWLYREDYAAAGMRMLPTTEIGRRLTGPLVTTFCLLLLPITLTPTILGEASPAYFQATLVAGLQFLGFGVAFAWRPSDSRAKFLLLASLLYLPCVLGLLTLDAIR